MTTEEKAKAYDEAIERARDVYTYYCDDREQLRKIESIFPELRESEGERIRKEMITYLSTVEDKELIPYESWIAWLEKQGEQKPTDMKPKFKAGDWIVFNGLTLLVNEVVQGYYRTISIDGNHNSYDWDIDNIARLWTIQDAKDGDVLATLNHIIIFKNLFEDDGGISYCHYDFGAGNPQFVWFEDKNWYFGKGAIVHPAIKGQRNLLFQKMKEKGYEWDAYNKRLKKLEQKLADGSEKYERIYKSIVYSFAHNYPLTVLQQEFVKSLMSQNHWKPDDEQMKALDIAIRCGIQLGTWEETALKSLKEQLIHLKKK